MPDPIEILKRCDKCLTNPCHSCLYGKKQVRDSDKLEYMMMALGYMPIERK